MVSPNAVPWGSVLIHYETFKSSLGAQESQLFGVSHFFRPVRLVHVIPFLAAVPSSFSPFVEFKEKTQQWKLLGE